MTKTFNISFPAELLKQVDGRAKVEYRSRSELLREAVIVYLQAKENWRILQSDLTQKARKLKLKNEDDVERLVDSFRE